MSDINCTFSCEHQKEGKCTMLTVKANQTSTNGLCPYCSKPEAKNQKSNK